MYLNTIRAGLTGLAVAALVATAPVAATAAEIHYKFELSGANEVPPNDSAGKGSGVAKYDEETKTLSWEISYDGLSGSATAAHFHGPAGPGENAPPVVPLSGDLASPISGSVVFTDEQAAAITGGKWNNWYFNIHSAKFPDGEIRGQVEKSQ